MERLTREDDRMTEVPQYDAAIHSDPAQVVRAELWCACGGCWRQLDPVSHVAPQVAAFERQHSGPGCRPTDPAAALAERETRRSAGFRARGEQHLYVPAERATALPTPSPWTPRRED